jgi:heterodisulfide reductase subunit A
MSAPLEKKDKVGAVLVVGGGIAGMQSSLDLADSGFKVYLLDTKPSIGGTMAQLDKTFPTNDCAMCIMAPKLVETGRHHNIQLITNSELEMVEGAPGNFLVTVKRFPRMIDEKKCTGCGVCAQKCPIEAIDEFNEGLSRRAATYVPYPQAVPLVYKIDTTKCIGCGICQTQCQAGAIDYAQKENFTEIEVGSIILAPGFEEFNPRIKTEYGYGVYPNVVSSIEFERILSASGPYGGTVTRPSDGEVPKKVAFIQCVGSRDDKTAPYCSSVCCMYAIKEAEIAQEHTHGLKSHMFFMDMRAFGKEFEYYYNRAEKEYGVTFHRCRAASVYEIPETRNLVIRYVDGEEQKEEEFDMVVLSVGFRPSPDMEKLAKTLGIKLNKYGFCSTSVFAPLDTTQPGIFVAGAFAGPKDIPDTVAQASGAASKASGMVASERNTLVTKKTYPPETDVAGQEPRIGVFVCHCGINIGSVVNVPEVVKYALTLPNVVFADRNLFTCSQDTQQRIKEKIKELNLNRVIVASCTPRTHEPLFRLSVKEGGLNPYLFEMANIRDQCSWVHMHQPREATKKAKDLVRMAVAKARMLEPLNKITLPVNHNALVMGGGLSGMTAALELASQGYEVHLVEKEKELGGNLRLIHYVLGDEDPQKILKETIGKVTGSKNIRVHLGTTVKTVDGFVGNFKSTLSDGTVIEHGAVLIAVGGSEFKPKEYFYGQEKNVMTQMELEEKLSKDEFKAKNVVMIQCVGSRNEERGYCSRVCCADAIKNALKIKEKYKDTNVYILYKDIRTYGFREDFYKKASGEGVIFIRYDDTNKPVVDNKNGLHVTLKDPISGENLLLEPDALILSTATLPNPDNEEIGKLLKIPLSRDKFFLEAHMKLRPVDFATEGVFLCGLAHGPKFIDECINQACGAAARASTVLSKDEIELEPTLSYVVDENCDGCAYCIDPCPYKALTLIEYARDGAVKKTVEVNESACKGCGVCQATCPKRGIYVRGFKLDQINAMINAALEDTRIVEQEVSQ